MAVCRYRQVYRDHTEDGSADRAVLFEGQEALQYYVEEREEYAIQNAPGTNYIEEKFWKARLFLWESGMKTLCSPRLHYPGQAAVFTLTLPIITI